MQPKFRSALSLLALVPLCSCVRGSPPGFSAGKQWSVPLVDTLSSKRLLVPVYIDHKGPFIFGVDPDGRTLVDAEAANRADVVPRTDLHDVQIGTLTVSSVAFRGIAPHTLDEGGRRIYGVIGHEVFADSIAYGFDRKAGVLWLETREAFHPPKGGHELTYSVPRDYPHDELVNAMINGVSRSLRLDFGRTASRLRTDLWASSGLSTRRENAKLIDDLGKTQVAKLIGIARRVTVQNVSQWGLEFLPFADNRYLAGDIDGTLGLAFFDRFAVSVDRIRHTVYLAPLEARDELSRDQRLTRWAMLGIDCSHRECADVTVVGTTLRVLRPVKGNRMQLVLRLRSSVDDRPLPDLEVNLPNDAPGIAVPLDQQYRNASVEVIDVSPFPRTCAFSQACVVPVSAEPVER